MNKNKSIQLLRGIAILAVLGFHAKEKFLPNGYLGVDVFFLVSGFLIIPRIEIALNQRKLKEFYKRRFNRLAPALLFTIVVITPLIIGLGSWKSHSDFAHQALWTLLLLGNIGAIKISGDYFNPSGFLPLVHTWSLSVEEQIYFILPLGMAISKKFLNICSLGSFLVYVIQEFTSERTSTILFYLPFTRIWEFHLGYLLTRIKKNNQNRRKFQQLWKYPLIMVLFAPLEIPRVPSTLLALILSGAVILSMDASGRLTRICSHIGDRSYSIYLLHMPILYIAKFSPLTTSTDRTSESLLGILVTLLLAEFSYRKIEFILVMSKHKSR